MAIYLTRSSYARNYGVMDMYTVNCNETRQARKANTFKYRQRDETLYSSYRKRGPKQMRNTITPYNAEAELIKELREAGL